MTTFIDFRYSAAQAAALRQDFVEVEQALHLSPSDNGYLAFEIAAATPPGHLAKIGDLSLSLNEGNFLTIALGQSSVTAPLSFDPTVSSIVAVRFGTTTIGVKYREIVSEISIDRSPVRDSPEIDLSSTVRILGRDTDRAVKWASLYYHRTVADDLCVEVVMDWQNPQAGIPSTAIATVEELLRQSNFTIKLTSYACDAKQARESDFARLFSTDAPPQITLHITPPLYTRANPETLNIGLFVVESMEVATATVRRCNEMDALIVPTRFVRDAFVRNGVTCPISVIPHGVDLDFFRPVNKKTPLKGGKGFNILAVAAFTERKNIFHLARAYMEEFRITEDIALHLYIRPEYLTTQHNIVLEFNQWENWHFNESGLILISTSYVSSAQLRDLYANADLYLMPSNEGFGLTLLQSMACGTPAVGLEYGGQTDFLNCSNGYPIARGKRYVCKNMDLLPYVGDIFYAPDRKQLRRTLRHLFTNREELVTRGKRARADVEAHYSWTRVGALIIEEIKKRYRQRENARPRPRLHDRAAVSWMIGVIDDAPLSGALTSLEEARQHGAEITCLFTRYGDVASAQMVKRRGHLLYRWDTTVENFGALAAQLVKTPWVGLLYSHEELTHDPVALSRFLASQPETVTEVRIPARSGDYESRLFRPGRSGGDVAEFPHARIS